LHKSNRFTKSGRNLSVIQTRYALTTAVQQYKLFVPYGTHFSYELPQLFRDWFPRPLPPPRPIGANFPVGSYWSATAQASLLIVI